MVVTLNTVVKGEVKHAVSWVPFMSTITNIMLAGESELGVVMQ